MLVKNFSNKGTDMSLRVASLDYLGVVAAKLRKDSLVSRCKMNTIDQIIKDIKQEEKKDNEESSSKNKVNTFQVVLKYLPLHTASLSIFQIFLLRMVPLSSGGSKSPR